VKATGIEELGLL